MDEESGEYSVGSYVERLIEGTWFSAEVLSSQDSRLTLRYLDDNKVESDVGVRDVRPMESIFNFVGKGGSDTLPKPLVALVEDDSESRSSRSPRVILHEDGCQLEDAVVILGDKDSLAVGGGLRALRYLKPSS